VKNQEIIKKENQKSFKLALEAANIGVWELNTSTWSLILSDNTFKFLGINKHSFKGDFQSFLNLIHPEDREEVKDTIDSTILNRRPFDTEFRVMYKKKLARWFRIRGDIGLVESEKDIRILGSIHDKTERKLAYDNLEERVQERTAELEEINWKLREEIKENRKMKKIIMDISEKERRKIGHDLHDGLSQQLGGILFMVQTLGERLDKKETKEIDDLDKIKKYLNNTLKYVRNLSKGLNLSFGETGLKFALQELTEQMQELYGLKVELNYNSRKDIKDEKISTNIFRIIQEALNNAVKHGNAKKATIDIRIENNLMVLRITDLGKGFPPNPNKRGMGLKIMGYRASQIDGSFRINKDNKEGTEVICEFPYR